MKKVLVFFLIPLLFLACTNWEGIPDRVESLVDDMEYSAKSFDENDWNKTAAEYHELMDTYYRHKDEYSAEDQARILKASGKYQALLLVNDVKDIASSIDGILSSAPSYIEGFKEVLVDKSEQFLDWFDSNDLEESIEELEEVIGDLVDQVSDSIERFLDGL